MSSPAACKAAFLENCVTFLSKHAVSINATMASKHLMTFAENSPFAGSVAGRSDVTALTAPTAHVAFSGFRAAKAHDLIKCGVPHVDLKIVAPNTADSFEVSIIPYYGDKGMGVKLPAGQNEAFAITQKINGCTLQVSGSPASPYASHSNAITIPTGKTRQDVMTDHVRAVEQAFAELEGEENAGQVAENRMYFNKTMDETGPGRFVRYAENGQQRVRSEVALGFTNFRSEAKVGHAKKIVKFGSTVKKIIETNAPPDNAIVAHRKDGNWSFYFCSFMGLDFEIVDQKKLKGWAYRSTTEKFNCIGITSWGKMWPDEAVSDVTLIPQVYNNAARTFKGTYA